MRAVVKYGTNDGDVELRDVPEPTIGTTQMTRSYVFLGSTRRWADTTHPNARRPATSRSLMAHLSIRQLWQWAH